MKKGAGYYKCYCKLFDNAQNTEEHDQFCHQYNYDINYYTVMSIMCSIILNIVNVVIEMVNYNYINKIGYKSASSRDSIILVSNFVT